MKKQDYFEERGYRKRTERAMKARRRLAKRIRRSVNKKMNGGGDYESCQYFYSG
jgi:hypothetical protein